MDRPLKCFNGQNNWLLGWFQTRRKIINPLTDGPQIFKIAAFVDFNKTQSHESVLVKVGDRYYLQYNRAKLYNNETGEYPDLLTVTEDVPGGTESRAGLDVGQSWTLEDYNGTGQSLIVAVCQRQNGTSSSADILILSVALDESLCSQLTNESSHHHAALFPTLRATPSPSLPHLAAPLSGSVPNDSPTKVPSNSPSFSQVYPLAVNPTSATAHSASVSTKMPTKVPTEAPLKSATAQPQRRPTSTPSITPTSHSTVQATLPSTQKPSRKRKYESTQGPRNSEALISSAKTRPLASSSPTSKNAKRTTTKLKRHSHKKLTTLSPSKVIQLHDGKSTERPTSALPTSHPSAQPSAHPTLHPTVVPSAKLTAHPTSHPTEVPTAVLQQSISASGSSNAPSYQKHISACGSGNSAPSAQPTLRPGPGQVISHSILSNLFGGGTAKLPSKYCSDGPVIAPRTDSSNSLWSLHKGFSFDSVFGNSPSNKKPNKKGT